MVFSVTDICNVALGHLGEARITSLEEDSVAGRACALHFAVTRDAVLRGHRWNFALGRAVLPRLAEAPAFGWEYQFELPLDCLRVLEMNGTEAGDVLSETYAIEGRRLLTNEPAVNLVYVRRVTDVGQYDSLFIEALAVKLAVVLSESIRGTTGKTGELAQLYERMTGPLARRVDANEGKRRKGMLAVNSEFVRARWAGV